MWYYPFSALFIAISSLLLAVLVWSKNKSEIAKRYLGFTFSMLVWSFSYFMWLISQNYGAALFWTRALTVGSIFLPITFLHFVVVYVEKKEKLKIPLILGYIYFTAIFILNFTPLVVRTVEPMAGFPYWPKPGILYHPYLAVFFLTFLFSYYLLWTHYKNSRGQKKDQARVVFIGTCLSLLFGIPNWFLWYNIPIPPVTNIFSALFVYFIGYAMIKHRFLDFRLALRQSTVFVLSLATILGPLVIADYLVYDWLDRYFFWISAGLTVIALLAFSPLRRFYGRLANKYFFSSLYDPNQTISVLSDRLKSTIEAEVVYRHLTAALTNSLHVKSIGIYSRQREKASEKYILDYRYGSASGENSALPISGHLERIIIEYNKIIIAEEIAHDEEFARHGEFTEFLFNAGIEVLIPLMVKNELIGIIALGGKESGDTFKKNDLDFLQIISYQIAFVLNNAMLYAKARVMNAELKREKEKTAAIIANLVDPILVISKDRRLIIFNQAAGRIFKLETSSLYIKIDDTNNFAMENFRDLFRVKYRSRTITADKKGGVLVEEVVIEPDNGDDAAPEASVNDPFRVGVDVYNHNEQIFKVTTVPIYDNDHGLLGHMKIFYDLTRERMVDMMKSEFVSIAAHQLRTPLSAIKWAIKMVLDGDEGKLNPGQADMLQKGYANNERVIALINDMLDASRIEEGKFGFNFVEENIVAVLERVLEKNTDRINDKHLDVKLKTSANNIITLIDEEKMEIALGHILNNAVEYTPVKGKIRIGASRNDGNIVITIADSGIGIPERERSKLFMKFFRGENVVRMQTDGSGLGLFITRNIILSHHGRINVESEENKGTKITITLPIKF